MKLVFIVDGINKTSNYFPHSPDDEDYFFDDYLGGQNGSFENIELFEKAEVSLSCDSIIVEWWQKPISFDNVIKDIASALNTNIDQYHLWS
jgi:hypothetical protein